MAGPVITTLLSPNPASGSTLMTGVEQTIASATAASGTFYVRIDASPLADGDVLMWRLYTTVAGGVERLFLDGSIANAVSTPIIGLPPLPVSADFKFTLQQTAGTYRTISWEVLNLNGT